MRGIITALLLLIASQAHAITPEQAFRCLAGEARGESLKTIQATAHALRNRGKLSGVYGCRVRLSPAQRRYMDKKGISQAIRQAWLDSATKKDPTHGATHWESTDFKKPYWVHGMTITYKSGKHIFYKH